MGEDVDGAVGGAVDAAGAKHEAVEPLDKAATRWSQFGAAVVVSQSPRR